MDVKRLPSAHPDCLLLLGTWDYISQLPLQGDVANAIEGEVNYAISRSGLQKRPLFLQSTPHPLESGRDPAEGLGPEGQWSNKREGAWVPESPCGKLLTEYPQ